MRMLWRLLGCLRVARLGVRILITCAEQQHRSCCRMLLLFKVLVLGRVFPVLLLAGLLISLAGLPAGLLVRLASLLAGLLISLASLTPRLLISLASLPAGLLICLAGLLIRLASLLASHLVLPPGLLAGLLIPVPLGHGRLLLVLTLVLFMRMLWRLG